MIVGITKKTTGSDIECILLARLGFSYKLISDKTGLSTSQVNNRLRSAGIKTKDYRNGTNDFSQRVITAAVSCSKDVLDTIKHDIKQLKL